MKIGKIGYIFIIIAMSFGCGSNDSNKSEKEEIGFNPISDSLIYEFINFVANDTLELNFVLKGDKILDQPNIIYDDFFIDYLKKDKDFSSKDIAFIELQLAGAKFFKIDTSLILGKEIISNDDLKINDNNLVRINTDSLKGKLTFWEDDKKRFGKAGYCILLKPLFSVDLKSVIISMSYHCGGKCGEGGIFIYKKINNKWVKIKEINRWVS